MIIVIDHEWAESRDWWEYAKGLCATCGTPAVRHASEWLPAPDAP